MARLTHTVNCVIADIQRGRDEDAPSLVKINEDGMSGRLSPEIDTAAGAWPPPCYRRRGRA